MSSPLDLSNPKLRDLLDRARDAGFLNIDQLLPFFKSHPPTPEEIEDVANELWAMGVELTEGMTQAERDRIDEGFVDGLRAFSAAGGHMTLNGRGWASFHRGVRVKKRKGLE